MKTIEEIKAYWRNPDEENAPEKYLKGKERTDFLISKIEGLKIDKESAILELGSNVGRNLNGLNQKGYNRLFGIEINSNAIKEMKNKFPELYAPIWDFEISKQLLLLKNSIFDIIFTMAVLCHIHPDEEKEVFDNMVRITNRYIITIEDEYKKSDRHSPRNYQEIFESRGMEQIQSQNCKGIKRLGKNYVYRCFVK